jgi:twinkle protein
MVSGMATEGDERKRIDELMTKLRSLVEALDIGLHVVTHLRKASGTPHEEGGKVSINDLRGSGAIGHVSNIAIGAERNQQSEEDPNTLTLRVIKNRFSGLNGIAGQLTWKPSTGRLLEFHSIRPKEHGEVGEAEDF